MKITDIAKQLLQPLLIEGATVVDFTLGNGNDSQYFLSYPIHKLYAFEIQETVYKQTLEQIQDARASLFNCGHEHVCEFVREEIDAGIFNFGYCPNGNKEITTVLSTSKKAVEDALHLLKKHGKLVLVLYVGHEEGKIEANYFNEWIKKLPSRQYEVMKVTMENKKDCPYIIAIEKLK